MANADDILGQWPTWADAVRELATKLGVGHFERGLKALIQHYPDIWQKFLQEHDGATATEATAKRAAGDAAERADVMDRTTMREMCNSAIQEMAKAEQAGNPALTIEGAWAKLLKSSRDARVLADTADGPNADLTVNEYVETLRTEQQRFEKTGHRRWDDVVADLAKTLGNGDTAAGLKAICKRAEYRDLLDCWEAEQRGE